uniref:Heat shock protein 70 n=1 Tax=Panagrolaimus sp. PS1159 TaxID=55785 RepID=A0AC35GPU2_9BILA
MVIHVGIDDFGRYVASYNDITKEIIQFEVAGELQNLYANQLKSEPTYNIPHKILIDNLNINAVGIDLGMTRCCVAVNRRNGIELVAIDNDKRQLPSFISFKEKDPICGQLVINQLELYANSTVFDIKRIIGRNFDEIQIRSSWPFEVINSNNSKPLLLVHGCESSIVKYPEEFSAILPGS